MINAALLSLVFALNPDTTVIHQTVDVIEVNHTYDEKGEPVFAQVILWHYPLGIGEIIAWAHYKNVHLNYDSTKPYAWTIIIDHRTGFRVVRTKVLKLSWTQYDPEAENKRIIPQHDRIGFIKNEGFSIR